MVKLHSFLKADPVQIDDEVKMIVSAKVFLSLMKRYDKNKIAYTKYIGPRFGSNSFGKFLIAYKHGSPTKQPKQQHSGQPF